MPWHVLLLAVTGIPDLGAGGRGRRAGRDGHEASGWTAEAGPAAPPRGAKTPGRTAAGTAPLQHAPHRGASWLGEGREDAWAPLQGWPRDRPDVWAGGSEPDFLTPAQSPPASYHLSHRRREPWAHAECFCPSPPPPAHAAFARRPVCMSSRRAVAAPGPRAHSRAPWQREREGPGRRPRPPGSLGPQAYASGPETSDTSTSLSFPFRDTGVVVSTSQSRRERWSAGGASGPETAGLQ